MGQDGVEWSKPPRHSTTPVLLSLSTGYQQSINSLIALCLSFLYPLTSIVLTFHYLFFFLKPTPMYPLPSRAKSPTLMYFSPDLDASSLPSVVFPTPGVPVRQATDTC